MFGIKEVSGEQQRRILEELEEAAKLHGPFFVLMAASSVIVTFGLLLDSPVVVIGAMLVAPLMTPIFSLSVALIRGRSKLLERSLRTEFYGVVLAILVAVVIGLLVPEPELTHEILSRTHPNLFDLAVALAAGLAGAFAMAHKEEINPALPGVAIAVALLPPLGVVGIGLSMRRLDLAAGALLLFLVNFAAIHLVSAAVFYVSGLATRTVERNPRVLLKNFGFAVVLLVVMAVFLGVQLSKLVDEAGSARLARSTLEQQVRMVEGARLSAAEVRCRGPACQIVATVETPEWFEPNVIQAIENVLRDELERQVALTIRSVQIVEGSADGYHFLKGQQGAGNASASEEAETSPAQRVQQLLMQQAKMVSGARLVDFSYDPGAQPPRVVATYLASQPFHESLENGIANLLRSELGQDVTLEVRYVGPLPDRDRGRTSGQTVPSDQ